VVYDDGIRATDSGLRDQQPERIFNNAERIINSALDIDTRRAQSNNRIEIILINYFFITFSRDLFGFFFIVFFDISEYIFADKVLNING
jgi:hypothetical protein